MESDSSCKGQPCQKRAGGTSGPGRCAAGRPFLEVEMEQIRKAGARGWLWKAQQARLCLNSHTWLPFCLGSQGPTESGNGGVRQKAFTPSLPLALPWQNFQFYWPGSTPPSLISLLPTQDSLQRPGILLPASQLFPLVPPPHCETQTHTGL